MLLRTACFAAHCWLALGWNVAHARDWLVVVGGAQLAFAPQTLAVESGDRVVFRNLGGLHNVVADDGAFRCARGCDGDGRGGSGFPSSQIWSFALSFREAGRFGYFCEPHGAPGSGMFGMILVSAVRVAPTPVSLEQVVWGLLPLAIAASAWWRLREMPARRSQPRKPR